MYQTITLFIMSLGVAAMVSLPIASAVAYGFRKESTGFIAWSILTCIITIFIFSIAITK